MIRFLTSLSLLIFSSIHCYGVENTDTSKTFDVSVKTGGFTGSITKPGEGGASSSTYQYGGISTGVALNHNYASYATVIFQAALILDLTNEQVSRQDIDIGFAYHILGGSKIHKRESKFSTRVWRNPYNLSIVILSGLHNYAASEKDDTANSITGSVLETLLGFQYRHDFNVNNSFGVESLTTVLDIPASVERLKPTGTDLSLFWRFLL